MPERGETVKGYYTDSCYWGFVNGSYMAFPTPDEYIEYMREVSQTSHRT